MTIPDVAGIVLLVLFVALLFLGAHRDLVYVRRDIERLLAYLDRKLKERNSEHIETTTNKEEHHDYDSGSGDADAAGSGAGKLLTWSVRGPARKGEEMKLYRIDATDHQVMRSTRHTEVWRCDEDICTLVTGGNGRTVCGCLTDVYGDYLINWIVSDGELGTMTLMEPELGLTYDLTKEQAEYDVLPALAERFGEILPAAVADALLSGGAEPKEDKE